MLILSPGIFLFTRVWSTKDGGAGDGQKEGEEREGIQRKGENDDKLYLFFYHFYS